MDWELTKWNRNSISARTRKVAAVDYVVHLGLYESTWSQEAVPASDEEVAEINATLEECGLLTPERQVRIEQHPKA